MKRRCAIYARYSSDLQRESSIEDQIRKCREFAAARGWEVLEDYIRFDQAVSGSALTGRDALQFLVGAAKHRPKPFDCLLVDDSSRLTRNLADGLKTTDLFRFNAIDVVFVSQNFDTSQENSRMMVTMHGMMDEQFLVGLSQKVHRGQEGRVLKGLNPGGRCYGYKNIPIEDPTRYGKYGRLAVEGVPCEIGPPEATVCRRMFEVDAS